MGLIRLIIIIISIYLFFRIFSQIIFPLILKFTVHRFQNRFYEQNPHLRPEKPRTEGEVKIEHIPDNKSSNSSTETGEYIDYEEIK